MAHSYDSTLLQRMGFADPDRKLPAHDAACIDLAVNPVPVLAALGIVEPIKPRVLLEQPLQKGEGKYATTIGFIDGIVEWEVLETSTWCSGYGHSMGDDSRCAGCHDRTGAVPRALVVEVKTKIENIGDLLRQMNLYREYKKEHGEGGRRCKPSFAVWSLRDDDATYAALLKSQGYRLLVGATTKDIKAPT